MWKDRVTETSLSSLADALGSTETREKIQKILGLTEKHQRRAHVGEDMLGILHLALVISELPLENVWAKVTRTEDLEHFFQHLKWIYKRVGQAFCASAFTSMGLSLASLQTQARLEDSALVEVFHALEKAMGERNFIAREKKFSRKSKASNLHLVHRIAERWFREWEVIDEVFPELVKQEILSVEDYGSADNLFYRILQEEAESPILKRSQSYFEVSPTKFRQFWERVSKAYEGKGKHEEIQKLFYGPQGLSNPLRSSILRFAQLSCDNDRLAKKLEYLSSSVKELADEAVIDLNRRGSGGFKHALQAWEHGRRYTYRGNKKTRDPYTLKSEEAVIIQPLI